MRPDRVYATGVWTPTVGYQPAGDAMQVAARFVQDRGLAGALGRMRYRRMMRRQTSGLGFPTGGVLNWLRNVAAMISARVAASRILHQLPIAATPPGSTITVDTSPRQTGAAQIVDAVRGLLPAPLMSTPATAASAISQGAVHAAAPTLPPTAAAVAVAPQADALATFLSNRWRQGY